MAGGTRGQQTRAHSSTQAAGVTFCPRTSQLNDQRRGSPLAARGPTLPLGRPSPAGKAPRSPPHSAAARPPAPSGPRPHHRAPRRQRACTQPGPAAQNPAEGPSRPTAPHRTVVLAARQRAEPRSRHHGLPRPGLTLPAGVRLAGGGGAAGIAGPERCGRGGAGQAGMGQAKRGPAS